MACERRETTAPAGGRIALVGRLASCNVAILLPWVYFAILAGVNIFICRDAFLVPSSGHWHSIHGQWMSLARIAGLDWLRPTWWRYWGGGAPLEFTYAPLVPMTMAAMNRLLNFSPALALNVL